MKPTKKTAFLKASVLVKKGNTVSKACKEAGIAVPTYYYYKSAKPKAAGPKEISPKKMSAGSQESSRASRLPKDSYALLILTKKQLRDLFA